MTNAELNELMDSFVMLDTEEKAKQVIISLKEIISIFDYIKKAYNIEEPLILNREMLDVSKNTSTIDDYLEATYAYIMTLEDISGKIFTHLTDVDKS